MSFINWNSKKIISEQNNNYMDGVDYDYIEDLPIGVYTKIGSKFKLIDGRNRFAHNKKRNIEIILIS